MRLSSEEREILAKLNKEQLLYLQKIAEDKEYAVFIEVVNFFIDIQKNVFFGNTAYETEKLSADLAFSRGNVAGLVKFLHIIGGAKHELLKRNKK